MFSIAKINLIFALSLFPVSEREYNKIHLLPSLYMFPCARASLRPVKNEPIIELFFEK
jgi:hypothetical protein